MLGFVLWVSDKILRIFECVGWGKDGVEKLIEDKKLKKILNKWNGINYVL